MKGGGMAETGGSQGRGRRLAIIALIVSMANAAVIGSAAWMVVRTDRELRAEIRELRSEVEGVTALLTFEASSTARLTDDLMLLENKVDAISSRRPELSPQCLSYMRAVQDALRLQADSISAIAGGAVQIVDYLNGFTDRLPFTFPLAVSGAQAGAPPLATAGPCLRLESGA